MIVECSTNHRRQSGDSLFGQESNSGNVVIFRGGDPIVSGGNIIGAVGRSTGTIEQDTEVPQAAIAALIEVKHN